MCLVLNFPKALTVCRVSCPRCYRLPPQGHCLVSFFFQQIILFLNDGFEGFSNKFATVLKGEGVGAVDNFVVGRVSGGDAEVADERFGMFEEE